MHIDIDYLHRDVISGHWKRSFWETPDSVFMCREENQGILSCLLCLAGFWSDNLALQ